MTTLRPSRAAHALLTLILLGPSASGCQQRCTDGPCCDDGTLAGPDTVCRDWPVYGCASACETETSRYWGRQHCSGISRACDGPIDFGGWETVEQCYGGQTCVRSTYGPRQQCGCSEACCAAGEACVNRPAATTGGPTCTCTHQTCASACCEAGEGCSEGHCRRVAEVQATRKLGSALSPVALAATDGGFFVSARFEQGAVAGDGADAQAVSGSAAALVAKYASDGTLVWILVLGSGDYGGDVGHLAATPEGGVVVAGNFAWPSPAVIGRGRTDEVSVPGGVGFVAKLTAAGGVGWVRTIAGTGPSMKALSVGADGSLVAAVSGSSGVYTLDGGLEGPTSVDGSQAVLCRYDASGILLWAHVLGTANGELTPGAIFVAADGSSSVVGTFTDPVTFGLGEPSETSLTDSSGVFFARFSATGALVSARTAIAGADWWWGSRAAPDGTFVVQDSALYRLDVDGTLLSQTEELRFVSALELAFTPSGVVAVGDLGGISDALALGGIEYPSAMTEAPVVVAFGDDGRTLWRKVVAMSSEDHPWVTHQAAWTGSGILLVYLSADPVQLVNGEPGSIGIEVGVPYAITLGPIP